MRGWQHVLLTLGLLWGSTHSHCVCQDDDHGSFSLEFSGEVSLSGDLPDCPFTIHHHDHPDDHHHHHDDGPDFSSGFIDLGEHVGSLHEEISAELELDVDNHHDYDHHDHDYDHSHHDHHHPNHDHDYEYEVDYTPNVDDLLFYYRK